MKNLLKNNVVIISAIIVLVVLIVFGLLLMPKKEKKKEYKGEYKVVEVKPTVSKLDDGTFYIFGAKVDQEFIVVPDNKFSYKVVDENNNEIATDAIKDKTSITIKPKNSYEEGKTYTITIKNGKFLDEDFKDTKKIVFSIVRKSTQSSKLNSNVIELSNNDVEFKDELKMITKKELKDNDIILIKNENDIKSYKIVGKENGSYILSIPEFREVYDEFDYYGSAELSLKEINNDPSIQDYLAKFINNNLKDLIIPPVYAKDGAKVTSKYDEASKSYIANFHIETDPNDKIFNKSFLKYHRFSFDYEVRISLVINYDINVLTDKFDVNIVATSINKPTVKLEYAEDSLEKIKNGLKAYTASANVAKMLKGDYDKIKTDNKELEQSVGKMVYPTPVPGLNAVLDIGLIMDFNLKANMSASLTNTNTITVGYKNNSGIYGNVNYSNKINADAFGSADMRLGSDVTCSIDFLGLANIDAKYKGGVYGKASVKAASEIKKDLITASLDANASAGLFSNISVNAKVFKYNKSKTIYDGELELYNYKLPISVSSKPGEAPVVSIEDDKTTTTTKTTTTKNSNNKTTEKVKVPNKKYTDAQKLFKDYMDALYKNDMTKAKSMLIESNYDGYNYGQTHPLYNNRKYLYFKTGNYMKLAMFSDTMEYRLTKVDKYTCTGSSLKEVLKACKDGNVVYYSPQFTYYYCLDDKECVLHNIWDEDLDASISIIEVDGYYYILSEYVSDKTGRKISFTDFVKYGGDISKYATRNW